MELANGYELAKSQYNGYLRDANVAREMMKAERKALGSHPAGLANRVVGAIRFLTSIRIAH